VQAREAEEAEKARLEAEAVRVFHFSDEVPLIDCCGALQPPLTTPPPSDLCFAESSKGQTAGTVLSGCARRPGGCKLKGFTGLPFVSAALPLRLNSNVK
jgi:hypothetical protein